MAASLILAGARTPIGRLGGALAGLAAVDLGAAAIAGALQRAGVTPEQVDYVVMGHVLQAGTGQITARQAAVRAGIPMRVPATTVNKVCLSGLHALYLADRMIQAGDAEVVVAGGMESMTAAPHLLPRTRQGWRLGDMTAIDSLLYDGLTCAFDACSMGAGTEGYVRGTGITRADQDAFAAESHQRAAEAAKAGRLSCEIVPIAVPRAGGDAVAVEADEGVRPGTTAGTLARVAPA
ncbi:MAG: beta-ketoacyl synthase N-terminal-like domain-containing protein, partial [Acidimicrobiales bacterium]